MLRPNPEYVLSVWFTIRMKGRARFSPFLRRHTRMNLCMYVRVCLLYMYTICTYTCYYIL